MGAPDARLAGAGRGRAGRGAAPGRAGAPGAGSRRGPDPRHRGRARAARRVHVPRHLPAHAAAAVHLRAGGDRHRHRGGRGRRLSVGDRIMCVTSFIGGNGSFAEECLAAADGAFPVPDGLTDAEAAGFWIPHLTGWIGLVDRGRLVEGDWLAVLGAAGGSGIAAVQLGHALGARVVAIVSDDERAAFCRRLGAEATINHRDGPARARAARPHRWARHRPACTTRSVVALAEDATPARSRATAACSRSASPAASGHSPRPTTW